MAVSAREIRIRVIHFLQEDNATSIDGDYAPIFGVLHEWRKRAILVFPHGCRGKEYEEIPERKRAIFLCSLEQIRTFLSA